MLSLYYFLFFATIGVYVIFFPLHFKTIGFTPMQIGLLLGVSPIVRFIIPFLKITITKNVYLFSNITFFISSLFLLSNNFYIIFLSFLILGISWALSFPYIEAIAVETLKEKYGRSRLWGSVGFMLIGLIFSYVSFSYITTYIILTLLTSLVALYFISDDLNVTKEFHAVSILSHWQFWLTLLLLEISFGGFYNFFTIYSLEHGISSKMIGWLWAVGVIFEIGIFIYQHHFINNFKPIFWIKISVLLTAVRWLLLYLFPSNLYLIAISQSLHSFSFAIFHTSAMLYLAKHYKNRTLAQQFYAGIGYGLASFVGSIFAGYIYGENLFLIEGIIALLAFIVLLLPQNLINNNNLNSSI